MAKRKRLSGVHADPHAAMADRRARLSGSTDRDSWLTARSALAVATGMLAAALVLAGFFPCDSIAVPSGSARYLIGLVLAAGTLSLVACPLPGTICRLPGTHGAALAETEGDFSAKASGGRAASKASGHFVELAAWGLAVWMVFATWANSDVANLRLAVNELWWWIAAAAALAAARRCAGEAEGAIVWLTLLAAIAVGVATHGWYQRVIEIPALIAEFERDPAAVLRDAGIQADADSALAIVFRNRLVDGGPTGPFALANSMAAMLVGGVVVLIGLAASCWSRLTPPRKAGWAIAIVVVLGMLLAARSRSSVASVGLVIALWLARWLWRRSVAERFGWRRGRVVVAFGGVSLAALLVGSLAWRFGAQTEWIGQAPASIAIRLRYWLASFRMAGDHPWVGVGPGQFKARYEAYRAAESTEQIADPHNWFFQAVTTGGWPAGILILAIVVGLVVCRLQSGQRPTARIGLESEVPEIEATGSSAAGGVIHVGAGCGLALAFALGLLLGLWPSTPAAILAAVGGVAFWGLAARCRPAWAGVAHGCGQSIAAWAVFAISIDLLFSGGLTVPGVALPIWLLVGILISDPGAPGGWGGDRAADDSVTTVRQEHQEFSRRLRPWRLAIGLVGVVVLLAWHRTAVLPVERAAASRGLFQYAWQQQRLGEAERAIGEAAESDRWDPEATLWMADMSLQLAIAEPSRRAFWEGSWREAEAETLRRVGPDPVMIRQLADGHLWHYQRLGEPTSLLAAEAGYRRAVELAPAHETYLAQLAEIRFELETLGRKNQEPEKPEAEELAVAATRLSEAGGYFERTLPYQRLMPARHLGSAAATDRVRRVASEVLAERLDELGRPE